MSKNTFGYSSKRFSSSPYEKGPKITREDLQTLRTGELPKPHLARSLWRAFVDELIHTLTFFSFKKNHQQANMCKNYGHIIRGKWKGYTPKCADCGQAIMHPDQLRKCTLKTLSQLDETQKTFVSGKH